MNEVVDISLLEFQTQEQQTIPGKVDKRKPSNLINISLHKPLDHIALCMSGGGFRAAAFSLGTLAYLNERKVYGKSLLEHVDFISSVSGGTITAAYYGVHKNSPTYSFDEFYNQLVEILEGEKLLLLALDILNTKSKWIHKPNRNVINAFAVAYGELIFKQKVLADISSDTLRCCFNATEFYRGLTFRFQNFGYIGNHFVKLDKESNAGKIKLADVLAASSCFPGGFEPINFPADFANEFVNAHQLQQLVKVKDYNGGIKNNVTIPLMDGGITDNQGITSAMIADFREREKIQKKESASSPIDLFLIADVASYFMDAYKTPKKSKSWLMRVKLNLLFVLLIILSLGGMSWFVYAFWQPDAVLLKVVSAFFLFPSVLIFSITLWNIGHSIVYWFMGKDPGYAGTRELFNINPKFTDKIFGLLRKYLGRNTITMLLYLAKDRIKSLMTMINDVNLKQVRRLIQENFYSNPLLKNRRCSNAIYDYSLINKVAHEEHLEKKEYWPQLDKDLMKPSDHLMKMAEQARTMDTTLWFDEEDQKSNRLQTIITCGKFTTCGNLIEYLFDLKYNLSFWNTLDQDVRQELEKLLSELIEDWKCFNKPV
jgi:predicted acylesterase/phospholipase RssA